VHGQQTSDETGEGMHGIGRHSLFNASSLPPGSDPSHGLEGPSSHSGCQWYSAINILHDDRPSLCRAPRLFGRGRSIVVVCLGRLPFPSCGPVNDTLYPITPATATHTIVSCCEQLVAFTPMSHALPQTTASSSSHFQQIFNSALKSYEKRTKNDLRAHPLAAQLQACDSPNAILAVLHTQVEGLNQSRNTDDRWTKWLHPTVNVLFAFSATLGEGVGLVCLRIWTDLRHAPLYEFDRSFHRRK
jgi:hypothetical protein